MSAFSTTVGRTVRGRILASGDTATIPDKVIDPTLTDGDEGDHDRFAHYVRKADIMKSAVDGVPVIALCGKKWIPNRNPDNYPVCPSCQEVYDALKAAGR